MAYSLVNYARVKNNYCIVYLGDSAEETTRLARARPLLELALPGIKIFLAAKDSLCDESLLPLSALNKEEFAYIRSVDSAEEIVADMHI